jgi:hypothetical protein
MKHTFTFLLAVVFSFIKAQTYSLAYYKGIVDIVSADKKNLTKSVGMNLQPGSSVILAQNAEAIFTGEGNSVVYLKKQGMYRFSDFGKYKTTADKSSLSSYYLSYVVHQMTHHEQNVEKDYKEQLKNMGGVSRGHQLLCLQTPLNNSLLMDAALHFSWKSLGATAYTFYIQEDSAGSIVNTKVSVEDTALTLNVAEQNLAAGKTYYWRVDFGNNTPCNVYSFRLLTPEEKLVIQRELNAIQPSAAISPALKQTINGKFYEDKGLFTNARSCYVKATKLEPGNESFVKLLKDFDARH